MQTENEKWMERQARKCSQVITDPDELNHFVEAVLYDDDEYTAERVLEMRRREAESKGYG